MSNTGPTFNKYFSYLYLLYFSPDFARKCIKVFIHVHLYFQQKSATKRKNK